MDGLFGTGIKFHRASNLRRGFREIYDHFLHPAEEGAQGLGTRVVPTLFTAGSNVVLFNLPLHFHTNGRRMNWFGQSTVDN